MWVLVVGGVDHAGVSIAEEFEAIDTQDLCRRLQLFGPDLAESRSRRLLVHVVDLAGFATSGGDEYHAVAVRLGLHHHAAGRDRLVVRVRVNQRQSSHHESNVSASCWIPPWPGPGMVRSAAAMTSGGDPSTAIPRPAQAIIDASLRPSPTAATSDCAIPSRSVTKRSADALSLSTLVNSRQAGVEVAAV